MPGPRSPRVSAPGSPRCPLRARTPEPRPGRPRKPPCARTPEPPQLPEPPKPPRAARVPAARRRARRAWAGARSCMLAASARVLSAPDPFQRVLAVRRDGQGARAGVARVGTPAHVAAVLQRRHQPGQRRRRDSLGGGQISQPHRPGMADGSERGQLRGRHAGQLVPAQPTGQPGQRDPQPGHVDHGTVGVRHVDGEGQFRAGPAISPRTGSGPRAGRQHAGWRFRAHPLSLRRTRRTLGVQRKGRNRRGNGA